VKERDGTRRSRARFRRGQGVRGWMTGGATRRGSSRFRGAPALGLAGLGQVWLGRKMGGEGSRLRDEVRCDDGPDGVTLFAELLAIPSFHTKNTIFFPIFLSKDKLTK
jgi:hypothetical protein